LTFVDTSFWVALQFTRDNHHGDARTIWSSRPPQLVTTNHVRGETWTFLNRRIGHRAACDFVDRATLSPRLAVYRVDDATEAEAWQWLRRHDERVYSFVDATSFATMRRLRLTEALAFDGDFTAAGFSEVRPS
jgi:predicted nucleic acid-binding protein